MEFRLNKSVHYYYATILLLIALVVGSGIKLYWTSGPMNMENINSIFEATIQMDELKNRNFVKELKTLVDNDRVRDAVKVMEKLEREVRTLNTVKEVDEYVELENSILKSKAALNGLLSYPELSSVILVLGNKVANFETFVVQNNWRTLTRMSRRIKAKIVPGRVRSPGFFNYKKVYNLAASISKDIRIMEDVTTGSVLTRGEKQLILTKIKTLKTEVGMLNKYLKQLKVFNNSFKGLSLSYGDWFKVLEPSISYKKIQFEKNAQNLLLALIGLVTFILLSLFIGVGVHRASMAKNNREVERSTLKVIKDGLIPLENKLKGVPSKRFSEELEKYREYVHKRMSFGSVFQDAIPFSSLLLDSNLNVTWANNLFYETWSLQDYQGSDESISWDYLQRFTNLGENDPVLAAHTDQVAGIYQIQLRRDEDEEALPYEMYVSPVDYAGQSRIMILLYPLRSLEETISNQTKAMTGPILRTLDALIENKFDNEFRKSIEKDYSIAGIDEVYDRFEKYNQLVTSQRTGLLGEIERLENNLYDQYKLVDDMKVVFGQKDKLNAEAIKRFKQAKDSIVSVVELRNEMEHLYQNTIMTSKSLFKDEFELLTKSVQANELLEENVRAFEAVTKVRDEFKQLKGNVDEFRTRIIQLLDQALVFQKNDETSVKMEQSLSKIKMEVRGYERILSSFGQVVTSLDVSLSKVQLIMERGEAPDFELLKGKFEKAREDIETDMFNVARLSRVAQNEDSQMVESLRGLVTSFKEGRGKLSELSELASLSQREHMEASEPIPTSDIEALERETESRA